MTGAANAWAPLSVDRKRGWLFVPTGSASWDTLGINRLDRIPDANAVVALDMRTGRKVWSYQLDPGRNMGKTNPLNDADLAEFIALQTSQADSPKSWSVDVAAIDPKTFDLSVKNPNGGEGIAHRSPQEIMDEIAALDAESAEVLGNIKALL